MTDKQVEMIAKSINRLAESIEKLGDRVTEDEPLNWAFVRGFDKLAKAMKRLTKP